MHLLRLQSILIAIVLLLLVTLSDLGAQTPTKVELKRVAVLTLMNKLNSHHNEINYLTAMIRGEVARRLSDTYLVMTEENMIALLPEDKLLEDCVSDCQITVGREIGASYIITGELVRFGQSLRLFIRLHDTRSGRLISNEIAKAKTLENIEEPTQNAITRLLDTITKPKVIKTKQETTKSTTTNVTSKVKTLQSDPATPITQIQKETKWSFEVDLGITQINLDDINQLSFGLGANLILNDYFYFSSSLHYGGLTGNFNHESEYTDYRFNYLNLLPAFGYYFVHQSLKIFTEVGLGIAIGSKFIETSIEGGNSEESSGFSGLSLMLGGGASFQLSKSMSIGLKIRYISADIDLVIIPTFFQNTLSLSWTP